MNELLVITLLVVSIFAFLGCGVWVGLTLAAFVALVFALTVVKVKRGDPMQGYDHVVQPLTVPLEKTE